MSNASTRVVVDVGPVRPQPAGVGLYVALLARELLRQRPLSLGLIGVRPGADVLGVLPPDIPRLVFRTPTYHAWMQLHAEADARSLGAGLVHYTNAAAPLVSRLPYVLTVHDLSLARMPLTHPMARWPILPINLVAIARARTLIVPSTWTARELARIGADRRRVVVINHAPTMGRASAGDAALVDRLGLRSGGYVLYFGTLEPRKNIARLVAAFERVSASWPELRLVLVGAPGWRFSGIQKRISASPARDRIVMTGYLEETNLAALIVNSSAVAYVSLYEGFGMPVLDALALGASVVTSNRTAMPEAAAGNAVLVDPDDERDIARGLELALERRDPDAANPSLRPRRTWADVAAEHVDVYRHAMARR